MKEKKYFTVSEFAQLSQVTRNTLHHYDTIGLLAPVSRGEDNSYRYYSVDQLAIINVIRTLQALGFPLTEIKKLRDRRTPKYVDEVFTTQIGRIQEKIREWQRSQDMLETFQKIIRSVLEIDEDAITIQHMPAENIILGHANVYSERKDDYAALFEFYHDMRRKFPELDMNYPVWAVFSEERIKRGDWKWPSQYYFFNPEGTDQRPAALYAVGYSRGPYGHCDALYKRMIEFIDTNGFEICGNAYEEYPLNEISVVGEENYLVRLLITVREKT